MIGALLGWLRGPQLAGLSVALMLGFGVFQTVRLRAAERDWRTEMAAHAATRAANGQLQAALAAQNAAVETLTRAGAAARAKSRKAAQEAEVMSRSHAPAIAALQARIDAAGASVLGAVKGPGAAPGCDAAMDELWGRGE